ncbi:AMP-binding protein [Gordonia sp. NPDC058843]|uniref:AMP-binding protein n=1 Tax=Gordonia sp. NPDC058843 TaxID=3346648 RepID=UPI0036A520B3
MPSNIDDVVVRDLLQRNARESPDEVFVMFEDGSEWTRQDGLEIAYGAAQAFAAAGVQQGSRVAIFLPNGPDFLRAWWGAAMLGATVVPVNLSYRGSILEHLLGLSAPQLIVAREEFDDQIASSPLGAGTAKLRPEALEARATTAPELSREIELWDPHLLLLTSGTTGPSKLAEISYRASFVGGAYFTETWGATSADIVLLDLPLFHGAALYQATAGLATRVRFAIRSAPNLNEYWEVARDAGATMGFVVSSMVPYLYSRPPRPADTQHSLRALITSPLPADVAGFQKRFNIPEIVTACGSTEVGGWFLRTPGQPLVSGYCGRVREGFEVRLVDEWDREVSQGEVGEAIVRAEHPWMMMSGYVNNPAAQASANRNGWFHTGDLFRCDEVGNYFFIDRSKDALRRRGENVSSFEVETEVLSFPGVAEAACVGFQEPGLADDEVKVWLVAEEGHTVDLDALFLHCVERMAHFMVPTYLELTDALPKTPSLRVKKYELRNRGNSSRTWSREKAGFKLGRSGLVRV